MRRAARRCGDVAAYSIAVAIAGRVYDDALLVPIQCVISITLRASLT